MPTLPKSLTTLCYLEQDDSFLMMHRVKKKNDVINGSVSEENLKKTKVRKTASFVRCGRRRVLP